MFKKILWVVFGLIASLVVFVAAVWVKPELFLPLNWARGYVVKKKLIERLEWKDLKLKTEMLSFFGKRIMLSGTDICATYKSPSLDGAGCLSELLVDVDVDLNPWHLKLTRVHSSRLVAGQTVSLALRDVPGERPKPAPGDSPLNFSHLYRDNFDLIDRHLFKDIPDVQIVVSDFQMTSPTMKFKASLATKSAAKVWEVDGNIAGTIDGKKLVAKVGVDKSSVEEVLLAASADWEKTVKGRVALDFKTGRYSIDASASGPWLPKPFENPLKAGLDLDRDGFELRASSNAKIVALKKMIAVRNLGCRARGQFLDAHSEIRINVNCPILITYPFALGPLDLKIQNEIQARVPYVLKPDSPIGVHFISSHKSIPMNFEIDTSADYRMANETSVVLADLARHLDFKFEVRDFNDWTKSLPVRYKMLPAPLNAMNGRVLLQISDSASENLKSAVFDIDFKGTGQALSFKVDTKIPLAAWASGTKPDGLTVDLNLRKLSLTMPQWKLSDPQPKVVPDSRFVTAKNFASSVKVEAQKAARAKSGRPPADAFDFNMNLATNANQPVRIHTSFLDQDVRMLFNFEIVSGALNKGSLHIMPLTTELFRRKIQLQGLTINWTPDADPTVDGLIHFPLPEYLVKLNVKGAMSKPTIYLESEPDLPEDDIYSVLVFGRPMSDLQGDQKDSAAQAQEAMTQGFFSLTSLYLFGGTPIQSIGYDPVTGQVSAQFKVSNKASVKVGGTGENVNEVTLRRSLGQGWSIQGTVNKENQQAEESYSTKVEKVIKY